jgi:uncharacterized protein YndB with AHSA1/START domain
MQNVVEGNVEATNSGTVATPSGVSVTIERTPEQVFAGLTDVARHTDWARGPEEITNISENPVRLGSTWQQTGKMLGRKIVATMRVDTYEENRAIGFGSEKPFPMRLLFNLEPVSGGTDLRLTAVGEPANLVGKVAMPLLARSIERQMESDLYALKAILEAAA